jgi:hypothetical protein
MSLGVGLSDFNKEDRLADRQRHGSVGPLTCVLVCLALACLLPARNTSVVHRITSQHALFWQPFWFLSDRFGSERRAE